MELTKRAASVLSAFVEAGHYGIFSMGEGLVGGLLAQGLVERVERDRYRVTKRGREVSKSARVRAPADEQERLADLRAGCDGVSHAAFGHVTFRALPGGALSCRACGVEFSPWAPGAGARAVLRDLAHPPRKARGRGLEAAGAAVLAAAPAPAAKSAGAGVRLYYLSEGGEVLSFDAGPLTPDAARKMLDAHTDKRWLDPEARAKKGAHYARTPTSGCLGGHLVSWWTREAVPEQDVATFRPEGARHVVLPSQVPDADAWCRVESAPHAQVSLFPEVAA